MPCDLVFFSHSPKAPLKIPGPKAVGFLYDPGFTLWSFTKQEAEMLAQFAAERFSASIRLQAPDVLAQIIVFFAQLVDFFLQLVTLLPLGFFPTIGATGSPVLVRFARETTPAFDADSHMLILPFRMECHLLEDLPSVFPCVLPRHFPFSPGTSWNHGFLPLVRPACG